MFSVTLYVFCELLGFGPNLSAVPAGAAVDLYPGRAAPGAIVLLIDVDAYRDVMPEDIPAFGAKGRGCQKHRPCYYLGDCEGFEMAT